MALFSVLWGSGKGGLSSHRSSFSVAAHVAAPKLESGQRTHEELGSLRIFKDQQVSVSQLAGFPAPASISTTYPRQADFPTPGQKKGASNPRLHFKNNSRVLKIQLSLIILALQKPADAPFSSERRAVDPCALLRPLEPTFPSWACFCFRPRQLFAQRLQRARAPGSLSSPLLLLIDD